MALFDRAYKLTIGALIQPPVDPVTGRRTIGPSFADVREYADLRIAFEIVKSMDESVNTAKIDITNISPATEDFLKRSKNTKVILDVGYTQENQAGESLFTILKGDIVDVKKVFARPDKIVTLNIGDGERALQDSKANKTYAAGTPLKQIALEKISELGVAISASAKLFLDENIKEALESPLNANGRIKDVLDQIFRRFGIRWKVQNDEVIIFDPAATGELILMDFESGLLSEPDEIEEGRIRAQSLLNPRVQPGQTIQLQATTLEGFFKVERVRHVGDSHSGDWITETDLNNAAPAQ